MHQQVKPGQIPPHKPGDELKIIKFMLTHMMYGGVGSVVFGVLVLYFDIGGIWTLASASRDMPVFIFLLFFGVFITFGGISMGAGVMLLGSFSDNDEYDDERRHHKNDDGAN
ncbi:hypothetical protein [Thalassospira mesophila]|uniref:hypothetical protein n=1 Tax=Thalassospira mesophila TaxID=1293891 RepID=UPI00117C92A9|nr:hypothetical protein [Thalassospira mesophila]